MTCKIWNFLWRLRGWNLLRWIHGWVKRDTRLHHFLLEQVLHIHSIIVPFSAQSDFTFCCRCSRDADRELIFFTLRIYACACARVRARARVRVCVCVKPSLVWFVWKKKDDSLRARYFPRFCPITWLHHRRILHDVFSFFFFFFFFFSNVSRFWNDGDAAILVDG